ncbi:MAG: YdcF family protein [Parvularculaceae bacterium]|nr:YdcF family protein [Parvularculaceae bacterium]
MRRLLFALVFVAAVYAAGLAVFVSELPRPSPAADQAPPDQADGIVVFTGGGDRITSAMALFERGAGKRLLISGVNPSVTRPDIADLWAGDKDLFECCVDLGLEAQTTQGNATELDAWMRANKFRSLILVTSEYHMPRALLETRERMPDIAITPYPVASGHLDARGRPRGFSDWRRLSGEYVKYLAVRLKTFVS